MRRFRQFVVLAMAAFAWWVVTPQWRPIAGPFTEYYSCNRVAAQMSQQGYDVWQNCRFFDE
jgi:hypothetical protein